MKKIMILFSVVIIAIFSIFMIMNNSEEPFITEKVNVEFYVDDVLVDSVDVEKGSLLNKPTEPIKEGYDFIGWYSGDGDWNFSDVVLEDLVLNAHFEVIPLYGISFNDLEVEYDSLPHSIYLEGNLSNSLYVVYSGGDYIDYGIYEITATIKNESTEEVVAVLSAVLTIKQIELTLEYSGDTKFIFDGNSHKDIVVTNHLEHDFIYTYSSDVKEIGIHTLTVSLLNKNYKILNDTINIIIYEANDISYYLEYYINEDGVVITGVSDDITYVIIPELIEGLSVVKIESGSFTSSNISFVYIPSCVKEVEYTSFTLSNYKNAVVVVYEVEVLTSYQQCEIYGRDYFFYRGISKEQIVIEDNVVYLLENGVVKVLTSLGSNDTIEIKEEVNGFNVTEIMQAAFYYESNLKTISIPATITKIGNYAFYYCSLLEDIDLGNIGYVGGFSFAYCISLTSLFITSNIEYIGSYAFYYCNKLLIDCELEQSLSSWDSNWSTGVNVSYIITDVINCELDGVTYSLSDNEAMIISYDNVLTTVVIPSVINYEGIDYVVTTINDNAFYHRYFLEYIVLPDTITHIGNYAFKNCYMLKEIILTTNIEFIGEETFYGCNNLTILYDGAFIPNGFSNTWVFGTTLVIVDYLNQIYFTQNDLTFLIEDDAATVVSYNGYESIITIPSTVTHNDLTYDVVELIDYLFYQNQNVIKIELPNTLITINDYAFYSCVNLELISIPNSVETIGNDVFFECVNLTIYCDNDESYSNNWNCGIIVISSDVVYTTVNGITYMLEDDAHVVSYDQSSNTVSIPNVIIYNDVEYKVVSIKSSAFYDNATLLTVSMGDNITSIGAYAFYNCNRLLTIYFSANITEIGISAFNNCTNLVSVELPNKLEVLGAYAFHNCTSLVKVEMDNNVTTIEKYAFAYCSSLNDINLSSSLTKIEYATFISCKQLILIELNSVKYIDSHAFSGCYYLYIENITDVEIHQYAFLSCYIMNQ